MLGMNSGECFVAVTGFQYAEPRILEAASAKRPERSMVVDHEDGPWLQALHGHATEA